MGEQEVVITKHAYKRLKQRFNLNKHSGERLVYQAFYKGLNEKDLNGKLLKFVKNLKKSNPKMNNIKVYKNYIFIFRKNILITVMFVPLKYLP